MEPIIQTTLLLEKLNLYHNKYTRSLYGLLKNNLHFESIIHKDEAKSYQDIPRVINVPRIDPGLATLSFYLLKNRR